MSSGPGNDPFSGSNVRNILNHVISPKVINDGSGGYTVKTDLINIDNIYISGDIYDSSGTPNDTNVSSISFKNMSGDGTVSSRTIQSVDSSYIGETITILNSANTGCGALNVGALYVYGQNNSTDSVSASDGRLNIIGGNDSYNLSWQNFNTGTSYPLIANVSGNPTLCQLTNVQSINSILQPTSSSKGTATANNTSTVVVSNTNVTANSVIILTVKTPTGANSGQAYVSSTTPSTGFSINSGGSDTSVYNYLIIN